MARDCVALMAALGHDRGSYVAFRTAMDHPETVTALAVLDSIPIGEALARADARFAAAWWHWFFLGQTSWPAERVISADPDAWYRAGEEAHADYRRAVHDDLEELWGDPVAIWRDWADDVRGAAIDSGHHMAEEAPEQLATLVGDFFRTR